MDVVDRSRVVASATWWHGTKPTAGGAAARGSLDRAVASFGTVPHPRAGCRCHRALIDWRLASADRCARQAGTSPRWSSGPVGSGGTREWSNASASQPSRDVGTGRRPAQPCPLMFKSNDPADLHAELGKCICRGTGAKIAAIGNRAQSFHKNNAQLSQNHHACVALWRQDSKIEIVPTTKKIEIFPTTKANLRERTEYPTELRLARNRLERRHDEHQPHLHLLPFVAIHCRRSSPS